MTCRVPHRALHAAALPFPTPQGTQAAIAAMLRALADRDVELLAYAHGDPRCEAPGVPIARLSRSFGDRSLRSGPSLAKIAQDIVLAREIARRRPGIVVAHHVEAAAASMLARAPTVFVAHTALGPELPSYARSGGGLLSRAGDALDRALTRGALATLAVSPSLAERLSALAEVEVPWLPIPWPVAPPISERERSDARRTLGIAADERVVVYAGNLDRYQGLELLFDALRVVRARLIVATSSADPLPADLAAIRAPIHDEPARRLVHAAADIAAVPRRAEGGLPIKLLDAMARGVPVAAVRRATAGLALDGAIVVADDDPGSLAGAISSLLDDRERARTLSTRATEWIARELDRDRFLTVYDRALSTALTRRPRKIRP